MTRGVNWQIRLAQRPAGLPGGDTWRLTEERMPQPAAGEVLVEVKYISITPAMRTWLRDTESYMPPVAVGDVMRAQGVGRVVDSRDRRYAVGETVVGWFGVQTYAVQSGGAVTRVNTDLAPAPTWLGLLGNTGLTAYFGLFDVGAAKPGETVLVSGAAGAVGSTVVQLAKLHGCRVVGVAGGAEKCGWLVNDLGLNAAINYKDGDMSEALTAAAPDGIDVFFDNVGGEILDIALAQLRTRARVVICGAISSYNAAEPPPGPSTYMSLVVKSASMTGFLLSDFVDRFEQVRMNLATTLADGRLVAREHVVEGGVARFPEALSMLFSGANTGKLVLAVA